MVHVTRTNSKNPDFIKLVQQLDNELTDRNGDLHSFYDQYNKIEGIPFAVVAYLDKNPVGCGAIKDYSEGVMEIKRMFVPEKQRGQGIASKVLEELEKWGMELGCRKFILETGLGNPEAIHFYKKKGYTSMPNFGPYTGIKNSVCFEKHLL